MGKITGFLEYGRRQPAERSVSERKKDYNEFTARYKPDELNRQAARCMDCGVPFCHSGCPLGNVIPEFNDAVYNENWSLAYDILTSTNNFPEFTGRVCPAPCESACVLAINQPAVAIEAIEKHIAEIAFEKKLVIPFIPKERNGKRVAVIGSGPAGLAAADQLNRAGYTVTVFEQDDAIGGLLRYGIPDFKLDKQVIDRRVGLMETEGVHFKTSACVGKNVPVQDLLHDFDAVIIAIGAMVPRDIDLPGRDGPGVYMAMPFLKQQNKRNAGRSPLPDNTAESNRLSLELNATGKKVIVIGGGDTGSDCVGTCNRQGATAIAQLARMEMPPVNKNPYTPWPEYPLIFRESSSHKEGVDRVWGVAPKSFERDAAGKLTGITVVDLEWEPCEGARAQVFHEINGSERVIPCDMVLLALGFTNPVQEGLLRQLELELDHKGRVKTDSSSYKTNVKKVFSCGDARMGASLVVNAISEGRECARNVDAFLSGSSVLENRDESIALSAFGQPEAE